MAKKFGVNVKEMFWTQGQYDIVLITEAPDDITGSLCMLGNVRTQSLRALSAVEMKEVLAKVA